MNDQFQFPGSYGGQVTLSFRPEDAASAGYVLVFAFYEGKLILTKNKRRGWEVPGGTVELDEWPLQAAIRETYEETGAELDAAEWIGQYTIIGEREVSMVKSVYVGRVFKLHDMPAGFETEDIRVCDRPPTRNEILQDESYSPIMRDQVYPLVMERIQQIRHPFTHQK
ncbi:NUDIX domain-containing protein [Effusibacillus dendaii]|uniref:Nudix hydrolase domain-containing protein n=1 Tax=Effusibacillus dendaii TaxID=2743772 RepID=A0A7I8DBT5_9BACL|nr:NUDIX domain-containing protein [Effusibacillus dendaii]BCJ86429.1 hypothetical protein skT53_14140 [Effusibacillus dendaii]